MAATLVLIAAAGITMGFLFRASGLAAGSILVLVLMLSRSVIGGQDVLSGATISLASVAVLQAGYLLGLLFSSRARTNNTKPHRKK
jgi:hypothetical protein